ncbi:MAG: winged helix-turn-helix transcriptional regulator [Phycisphaerales bacterium]|nr:metalloregulator ArsR/SmtB family transcription factor [Phycisphaerae bacterium]NNF45033.1 winged helix-turn-helix transcriptional regulator [Phycisphaerales bacterium]NNM27628.1 winged helix-turn-helix transcriptional regulator [Phycisphaerales bacterium]
MMVAAFPVLPCQIATHEHPQAHGLSWRQNGMKDSPLADVETVGHVAGLMRLLADPTRLRLLHLLQEGEINVSTLCGALDLAQPTVSHHLGLLRSARLVRTRRSGKQVFYALNPDHVRTRGTHGLRLIFEHIDLCLACGGRSSMSAAGEPARA